jgi:hypothetical protein
VYYKVLCEDGNAYWGGTGQWHLPTQGEDGTWIPGKWMPAIEGALVPCENGYHLCRKSDLLDWLGPVIFEAEYRGETVEASNKVVAREARLLRRLRWDARVARLFACDCAEHVLPIFETERPDDPRPRQAIEVARRYANSEATDKQLAATRRAAWTAAEAAWAAGVAGDAGAARDAARVAARVAAWAARAAARAAAWAAAWDAWDAATAAKAAARVAAGAAVSTTGAASAASAAERQWQTERLLAYLEGRP